MDDPGKKDKSRVGLKKWGLIGLIVLLFLLCLGSMIWCLWLPRFLEQTLLPQLARQYGIALNAGVRNFGITGTDFSDVEVRLSERKPLKIDSLRIDYTFMPRKPWLRISRLTISGMEISVEKTDQNKWLLNGYPVSSAPPEDNASAVSTSAVSLPYPPDWLELLEFRNSRVRVQLPGEAVMTIPFEAELRDGSRLNLSLRPGGQLLETRLTYDPKVQCLDFQFSGKISPALLPGLPPLAGKLRLTGQGTFYLQEVPGKRLTADVEAAWETGWFSTPALASRNRISANWQAENAAWTLDLQGEIALPRISPNKNFDLQLGTLHYQGTASSHAGLPPQISGDLKWMPVSLRSGDMQLQIPEIRLTGDGQSPWSVQSSLELHCPGLPAFTLGKILAKTIPNGIRLTLQDLYCGATALGEAENELTLKNRELRLTGSYRASTLQGLQLHWNARLDASGSGELTLDLPPWRSPEPINPGRYVPKLGDGFRVNATISAGLRFALQNFQLTSGGSLMVRDASLEAPELDLFLKGGRGEIQFADLLHPQTRPGQVLTLEEAKFGNLKLTQSRITFQLYTPDDILLESAETNWCGGNIHLQATRLRSGRSNLSTMIYCDGVSLAQALRELGVAQTEGEGKLTGKIPVKLRRSGIFFENAYLYSEPGANGIIRLRNARELLAMAGAANLSELDLASEALKNFSYEWAKLNFDTTPGGLTLHLQFDGKPLEPLPFTLDPASSRLVRSNQGKATFQGLQLNVNLTLPLNRLLQFNERLNQLRSTQP